MCVVLVGVCCVDKSRQRVLLCASCCCSPLHCLYASCVLGLALAHSHRFDAAGFGRGAACVCQCCSSKSLFGVSRWCWLGWLCLRPARMAGCCAWRVVFW